MLQGVLLVGMQNGGTTGNVWKVLIKAAHIITIWYNFPHLAIYQGTKSRGSERQCTLQH